MEESFLNWIASSFAPNDGVRLGVGDDAAVLRWQASQDLVVSTDAIADQVDFLLEEVDPQLVGRKALAINLSDVAAMAAQPVAAVSSLILPCSGGASLECGELAREITRGMVELAEQYDVSLVGGDLTTWDAPLAVNVTILGRTTERGPLTRDGAQVGDRLLVTGSLGGSILGRHFSFEPRIAEALRLHEEYQLHAGMDVSDGLALDASRLAKASGCGVAIEVAKISIHEDARRLAQTSGKSPLEHALGDGEDFELLIAAPPTEAERMVGAQPLDVPVSCIGEFVQEPGLWRIDEQGSRQPLAPSGFLH